MDLYLFVAVAAAALVFLATFSHQRWLRAVLTSKPLVLTGDVSYGIYILEKIPLDVMKKVHLHALPVLAFVAASAALGSSLLRPGIFPRNRFCNSSRVWLWPGKHKSRPTIAAKSY